MLIESLKTNKIGKNKEERMGMALDILKKERIVLQGDLPSPLSPPSGCVSHTRCPYASEICSKEAPPRYEQIKGHVVYCHLYNGKNEM